MKFWVGVTDNRWFQHQAEARPDEVNFWQPGASPPFANAPIGMPFLFKLKSPHNDIAGGGYYVAYSTLPVSLAWEVFGLKNGCQSLDELRALVTPLKSGTKASDEIGCTVLSSPFFFSKDTWIHNPIGWAPSIQRGKMYDSASGPGTYLWNAVAQRIPAAELSAADSSVVAEDVAKYGTSREVCPRLGQGAFRLLVTDAYERRCAITGESTLLALEAAHIVPYSGEGGHEVQNGLLLRADFHRLFDAGLVGITPEMEVRISPRIREAWFNGKAYYQLDRRPLAVIPSTPAFRPDPDRLEWHFRTVFQN